MQTGPLLDEYKQKVCATSTPTVLQLLMGLERARPKAAPQNLKGVDAKYSILLNRHTPSRLFAKTHAVTNSIKLYWCSSMSTPNCFRVPLRYPYLSWKKLWHSLTLVTRRKLLALTLSCFSCSLHSFVAVRSLALDPSVQAAACSEHLRDKSLPLLRQIALLFVL